LCLIAPAYLLITLLPRFAAAKSKAEVDSLVNEFLAAVDTRSDDELRARGWPKSMYGEQIDTSRYSKCLTTMSHVAQLLSTTDALFLARTWAF
jgi:hypothetical protein